MTGTSFVRIRNSGLTRTHGVFHWQIKWVRDSSRTHRYPAQPKSFQDCNYYRVASRPFLWRDCSLTVGKRPAEKVAASAAVEGDAGQRTVWDESRTHLICQ